jgi:hypothetical protein
MSAEPITHGAARPYSLAALRRVELLGPAVVALGFAALVVLTWGAWGDLGHDTGYDWVAAQRVAGGDLPYADFPYIYGPLGVGLRSAPRWPPARQWSRPSAPATWVCSRRTRSARPSRSC